MLRRIYILAKRKDSRYNSITNGERGSIMRKRSKHIALLPHQANQEKTNALSLAAPKGIAGRAAMQAIKNIDAKKAVTVAGGMTDNPRYALYGSKYTVLDVTAPQKTETFDLAGRCCESGDIIQPEVSLNAEIKRGDLVAVCTTGAYNYSMASNYNRVPRPPIVMLGEGGDYLAVRRETLDDIVSMDV